MQIVGDARSDLVLYIFAPVWPKALRTGIVIAESNPLHSSLLVGDEPSILRINGF